MVGQVPISGVAVSQAAAGSATSYHVILIVAWTLQPRRFERMQQRLSHYNHVDYLL